MDEFLYFKDNSPDLLPGNFSYYEKKRGKHANAVMRMYRTFSNKLKYMKKESKYTLNMCIAVLVLFILLVIIIALNLASSGAEGSVAAPDYYTHQQSYHKYGNGSTVYKFAVIADMDEASKKVSEKDGKNYWESNLIVGTLTRDQSTGKYSVEFEEPFPLTSSLSEAGRGMELSELVYFNNMLLAFDDRTGVVFEIIIDRKLAVPRYVLMEGDGTSSKGQKTEWATVKDGVLYSGSIGKEWTDNYGRVFHYKPQWIKTITPEGTVRAHNWKNVFNSMRDATGTALPGYLLHEAVCYNPANKLWYFMPRRESKEEYNEVKDEERGTNLVIAMDEEFNVVSTKRYGTLDLKRGTSSCKFIPYRENEFVSIQTMEFKGEIKSYITVMNLDGEILLPATEFSSNKYEGVEFI